MLELRRAGWLLLLPLLLCAPAAPARAAEPDKEHAKALFDTGLQAFDRGDYNAALQSFSAAYAAFPSSKLLFNVGQAALNLNRYGEAAEAFQRFIDAEGPALPADDKRIAFARKSVHDLHARKKVVEVVVQVEPADALLELDGERPVKSPFLVSRGEPDATHVLTARAPGFQDGSVPFAVHGAVANPVKLVLAPKPVDKPADVPPAVATQSAPPPPTPVVVHSPQRAERRSPTGAYVAWGVGAGLLVAGAAYGASVGHRAGEVSGCGGASLATCASQGNAQAQSLRTQAYVVDLLFAGAVVAGTAGTVLFFLSPSPGGGTAGVEGSF